jgi:hypothetical protein
MQQDFHYYVVYQLAKLAGFSRDDAETIAYASQYVDDATESEPIEPFDDQHFDTVRTAHYNLGAFGWDVQKKVYMPFHFLPTSIRWLSPETFSYCTEPTKEGKDSQLANLIIDDAAKETNEQFRLIRIGVATHTIADTFAHFGFSGRHHDENDVNKIWHENNDGKWELKLFESFIADIFVPRIGHVEASSYPDYPFLKWRYTNGDGSQRTRDNVKYSLDATNCIYKKLKAAKNHELPVKNLSEDHPGEQKKIESLLKKKGDLSRRIQNWKTYTGAAEYDRTAWRSYALDGDVKWDDMSISERKIHTRRLKGKPGFDSSNWAYFHRAAHKQRSLVLGWIN